MKLTFHPGTDMAQAMAETIGYVNRARAFMPPGTVGAVHHAVRRRQRAGRLPRLHERDAQPRRDPGPGAQPRAAAVRDPARACRRRRRSAAASARSSSASIPTGCASYGMSPDEVIRAVTTGNVIMPSGSVNIGDETRISPMNSVVGTINELLELPIRTGAGPPVSLRDVGTVSDSTDIPTATRWSTAGARSTSRSPSGPTPRP